MSMKKILMAAVAVSALTAGAANAAATIDNLTEVSGVALTPAGSTITVNPFTIASELNTTSTSPTATAEIMIKPTTTTTIAAGSYIITYNVTGGTFTTSGVTTGSLVLNGSNVVSSVNSVSSTSIAFNVTVASGDYLETAVLTNAIILGVAKSDVSISGSITTAVGAAVDGGTIAAKKIIDYRTGYVFEATAADKILTVASGFKAFTSAATSANIGTGVKFALNTGVDANDLVYKAAGTTASLAATTDLTTAVLTLAGDVSALNARISAVAPDTSTTNVFTAAVGSANLALLQGNTGAVVTLQQKTTPLTGSASDYSITPVVTMASGYTAPTFAAVDLGSVSLEGTNFFAAWVGDGTNGISYTIRVGNRTTTAVTGVSVELLNSLNATTVTTCAVGTLPASGELLITSASLNACFGNYGRADLRITVQATTTAVTAKMRSVSAGVVNEQSLGGGTTVAGLD